MSTAKEQVDALLKIIQENAYAALAQYEKHGKPVPTLDSTEPHPLDTAVNTVDLRRVVRHLEGACDQLCATLAAPAHIIANRAQDHYWACLRFVAKFGVTDVLAKHPNGLHIDELAKELKTDPGKLASVLRVLATKHCYREVSQGVFANNRLSLTLQSTSHMSNFVLLMTDTSHLAAHNLPNVLADPQYAFSYDPHDASFMRLPEFKDHSGTAYDVITQNDRYRNIFGRAMIAMNDIIGSPSVVEVYPWSKYKTICDCGSGVGSFVWSLFKGFSHIHATLLDLPQTIGLAQELAGKEHPDVIQSGRVTFIAGDFFKEIPAKDQDIYYLRNVIHNWSDEKAIIILRNLLKAMGPNSRVLIHDYINKPLYRMAAGGNKELQTEEAPEPLLPNFGAGQTRIYNQDLTGMVIYNSKERTVEDIIRLGKEVGLKLEKVWDLGETSVMELVAA